MRGVRKMDTRGGAPEMVMLQRNHRIGILGLATTLLASAGWVNGQGTSDVAVESKPSSDEEKKPSAQRRPPDENKRPSDGRDRKNAEGRSAPASGARVNEAFSFLVGSGCQFSSTIRGTIRSAHTVPGDEPKYIPSLVVNAWVTCQNNTEQRVIDNTLRETPMTRSELEQAIELRGSLIDETSGRRCAYVPDFAVNEGKVAGFGVAYLCPVKVGSADGIASMEGHRPSAGETRARPAQERQPSEERGSAENRPASDSKNNNGENRSGQDNGRAAEGKQGAPRKGPPPQEDPNFPDDYE